MTFIERKNGRKCRSDPGLLDWLVKRGFHRDLGARYMRNAIERELGDAFSTWELTEGSDEGPVNLFLTLGLGGLRVMADPGVVIEEKIQVV